jgi:hypothetical protein
MVESHWWVDGLLGMQPYEDVEVGEGWLITASDEAWEALLREWADDPVRTVTVRRSFSSEEGHEMESESTQEEDA